MQHLGWDFFVLYILYLVLVSLFQISLSFPLVSLQLAWSLQSKVPPNMEASLIEMSFGPLNCLLWTIYSDNGCDCLQLKWSLKLCSQFRLFTLNYLSFGTRIVYLKSSQWPVSDPDIINSDVTHQHFGWLGLKDHWSSGFTISKSKDPDQVVGLLQGLNVRD